MRFSNKALRHWSLLTEGLLDRRLGTRALWEEGDVGGGGEGRGNTELLSEKAAGWAGEGRHAANLQAGSRVATGRASCWRILPKPQALELLL